MTQYNIPIQVAGFSDYIFKSDHRDGTRIKSQWTVTTCIEMAIYTSHYNHEGACFFGLKLNNSICEPVGNSALDLGEVRPLFVCKYVRNQQPNYCHGYPADPELRHQDRPPMSLLLNWRTKNLINKKEMNRFRGLWNHYDYQFKGISGILTFIEVAFTSG